MLQHALIRAIRFRARHRYGRKEWSEERNRQTFGAQTETHEHEWRVEVTVEGALDPETGFVMDLGELDAILDDEVRTPLAGFDLNRVIPEVARGEMQPSTEALAGWVFGRVARRLPAGVALRRVRVRESDDLGAEVIDSRLSSGGDDAMFAS